jgi:hypothetical protein
MSDMKVGDACWNPSFADMKLSPIAQVAEDETSWFLATHSPITYKSENQEFQQEDLFKRLITVNRRDYLVVVNGEPGSGKSQLINWLKLRFDSAIKNGQKSEFNNLRLRSVLVRRRSGSLKDALQQLVDQLPELDVYLAKVRAAIDGVQGKAAGQRLCTEMFFSLQDHVENTPKLLKKLHEIFLDPRAMEHLCRKGGAVELNLKRLVEASDTNQRESLPSFSVDDFTFPIAKPVKFDDELKERLEDDPSLRALAAETATKCLRQAIAGLTGLKGHTLNEVFRDIRGELARRGEALALFIEDVSTLSVLDEELVNALQPVNDSSLCPLLSVLGMTLGAFSRLPDNLRQRIDMTLELSDSSSFSSSETDSVQVDRFVARYLNALRLGETKTQLLADASGGDEQMLSACSECTQRDACFTAFGSVEINRTQVGMYPLGLGSSIRLLNGLSNEKLPKTPRSLLQYIVSKLLKRKPSDWTGKTIGLEIKPKTPKDYGEVEEQLLAKWNSDQRSRMSYLVYYWTGEDTFKQAVPQLDAKLSWWNLPTFEVNSRKKIVVINQDPESTTNTDKSKTKTRTEPRHDHSSTELTDAMGKLDQWYLQNEPLKNDAIFRDVLLKIVKESVQLEEVRNPSNRIQKLAKLNSGNVEIEGQTTRAVATSRVRFKFSRSEETYNLLRNLLAFKYSGNESWDFNGGESARRSYGFWLSRNLSRIISSFSFENSSKDIAVQVAVKFLRLGYRLSYRKDLPSDIGGAVESLVSFNGVNNICLTNNLNKIMEDLPIRINSIRDELLDELAVRQGNGGVLYIDSRPIIENISGNSLFEFKDYSDLINKTEFPNLSKLLISNDWSLLVDHLIEERKNVNEKINNILSILRYWNISTENINEGLEEFFKTSRTVIQTLESTKQNLGNDKLQKQIIDLRPANVNKHVTTLVYGITLLELDIEAMLGFDMKEFIDSFSFMSNMNDALDVTNKSIQSKFSNVVTTELVELSKQNAITSINSFLDLMSNEGNTEGDN